MDTKQNRSVRSNIVSDMINFFPNHFFVKNCLFTCKNENPVIIQETENEANLVNAIAQVASDNDMTANEVQHLFPAILRMLKSKSQWAK
jgi:hypothetical protein